MMRPLPEEELIEIYRETIRPLYAYVYRRVGGDGGVSRSFAVDSSSDGQDAETTPAAFTVQASMPSLGSM